MSAQYKPHPKQPKLAAAAIEEDSPLCSRRKRRKGQSPFAAMVLYCTGRIATVVGRLGEDSEEPQLTTTVV